MPHGTPARRRPQALAAARMGMRCKALFYLSRAPRECRFSRRASPIGPDLAALELPCGGSRLLRAVPVHDLHAVSGVAQVFADLLGDHDGAVLSAGASEGDRQIALAFVNVVRQQVDQQIGDARDEFLVCGNERMYLATRGSRPVSGRNSGTKCGLGRKRTSKTRSASSGTPCRNPKLTHETRMLFSEDCCLKALGDVGAQFVHIELGSVDDEIGNSREWRPGGGVRL